MEGGDRTNNICEGWNNGYMQLVGHRHPSFLKTIESIRKDEALRAILTFREIGRGQAGIETFCGYMNIPPPMTESTYNNTVKETMLPIYLQVAQNDMEEAAADLRVISNDDSVDINEEDEVCDIAASFDGTWQRRGYSSLNGVVTTISIDTGKCLAYECLTKTCKSCEMWQSRKGTEEYEKLKWIMYVQ